MIHARIFLFLGALSAAVSVALGAAGAHALASLTELSQSWFRTALQYQQFHALALIAVGLIAGRIASAWIAAAGWLMVAGTLLFCGNLYLRSLADFHALHAVTPWGGGAFILGWLALAAGVVRGRQAKVAVREILRMGDPRLFEVARPVADPAAPYIRDLRRFGFTDVLFPGLAGAPPKD